MPLHWQVLPPGTAFHLATHPQASPQERVAARVLAQELGQAGLHPGPARTSPLQVRLQSDTDPQARLRLERLGLTLPGRPEAYALAAQPRPKGGWEVLVAGRDGAGVLYGIGRLLRGCALSSRSGLGLPAGLHLAAHPWHAPGRDGQPAVRGHQIAMHRYRYLWSKAQWEGYIRELALWGSNWLWLSIGSDLAHAGSCPEAIRRSERHARLVNMVAALAAKYGLRLGLHVCGQRIDSTDRIPEMGRGGGLLCPSVPAARQAVLRALDACYARLERLDGVFTASGDPGGCRCRDCTPWPATYLEMAAEQAAVLRKHHPAARYFLSNQQMAKEENELFCDLLAREQPEWLDGVLWGPQSRSLAQMRERIPERYPVLLYPDLTHTTRCQNPVQGWERERALLFERASPNYRPLAIRELWESTKAYAQGNKAYSEGLHDDLNKAVWSASQWLVTTPGDFAPIAGPERVEEIVLQYARRYFGPEAAELAAEIMFTFEENWRSPLLGNDLVGAALQAAQELEALLPAERTQSWRWQMLLIRAELDRYLQLKVAADRAAEARAGAALAVGDLAGARRKLGRPPRGRELRGLQASIRARHDRIFELAKVDLAAPGRLDLDFANRRWLLARLQEIEQAPRRRQAALVRGVLEYEDPGPGGYYDNCGDPWGEPHLVAGEDYFMEEMDPTNRLSHASMCYGRSEWDAEVAYLYQGLDPHSRYQVELTYVTAGRMPSTQELWANGQLVHGPLSLPVDRPQRHCYPLPAASYAGGWVELRFRRVSGRGPLVSEIWIKRLTL